MNVMYETGLTPPLPPWLVNTLNYFPSLASVCIYIAKGVGGEGGVAYLIYSAFTKSAALATC
jgi:hypothetical protein